MDVGAGQKPVLLEKLLRALALQIGSEVSFQELGQMVRARENRVESECPKRN